MMKEFAIFHHARMVGVADYPDDAERHAQRLSKHPKAKLLPTGELVHDDGAPTGYRVTGWNREAAQA